MEDKVYEMSDEYKQTVAGLLELFETRDELLKAIKIAPPDRLREGQEMLILINEQIEKTEAMLAEEYETYQAHQKALEAQKEKFDEMKQRMEMVFIYVKYRLPEKLEELKATIFNEMTPEWIQDFYDNVAILEATRLEELIAEAPKNEWSAEFFGVIFDGFLAKLV